MPRTGPRRPLLAVKVAQEEIDALDALAERAGVKRSDVVRGLLEVGLKGLPEGVLLDYLAASRGEEQPAEFTEEWRERLLASQIIIGELNHRAAGQG